MKVRDAMTENVLTFTPESSLRRAAKFMADHNVGAVVIIDPEQPGPGIITERDLVRSLGKGEDPDSEHVSEHLTSNAAFADIEWDLEGESLRQRCDLAREGCEIEHAEARAFVAEREVLESG